MSVDAQSGARRMHDHEGDAARTSADELCLQVNKAGGVLLVTGDRLRVVQPSGGLPDDLRRAIVTQRAYLVEYLTHGRELTDDEVADRELASDPHGAECSRDTDDWCKLFRGIIEVEGLESRALHALRAIRMAGARIEEGRIVPDDDLLDEWQEVRTDWLMPHADRIRSLLSSADNAGGT